MIFCVDKISLGVFVLCSAKIWNNNESIWCYLDFEISKKVHPSGWNLKSSVLFRHEKGQNSLNVLMNEPCWTSRYRTARACLSWWQIPIQKRFQQVIVRKCIVLWTLFRKSSEQLGCFREKKMWSRSVKGCEIKMEGVNTGTTAFCTAKKEKIIDICMFLFCIPLIINGSVCKTNGFLWLFYLNTKGTLNEACSFY